MSETLEIEKVEKQIEDLDVPLTKAKKPRSEKQLAAFEILKQKRKENIERKLM